MGFLGFRVEGFSVQGSGVIIICLYVCLPA